MKVILYTDVKYLGEMGDVKNVATGYARNYLFPHMYAVPYNDETIAYFETRKEEIEARKEQKRKDSASLKDKLEALTIDLTVPASSNGKLYGAVSAQTVVDYLAKQGFEVERKRVEIPGVAIKSTGNYHCVIHLYEAQTAEVKISVKGQSSDGKAVEKSTKDAAKQVENAEEKAETTESSEEKTEATVE